MTTVCNKVCGKGERQLTQITKRLWIDLDAIEGIDHVEVVGEGYILFLHMNSTFVHEARVDDLNDDGRVVFADVLKNG